MNRPISVSLACCALVAVMVGCLGEPSRLFEDVDGSIDGGGSEDDGASQSNADGSVNGGGGPTDSGNGGTKSDGGGTTSGDASTTTDGSTGGTDSGKDSGPTGCGPTNTVTNCSACGIACDAVHSQGAACNGTTCQYSGCTGGYSDCDKAAPNAFGCETSLSTTTNCGGCNNVCDTTHSMGAACNGTSCTYSACVGGYDDCNKGAPDTDGCESSLSATTSCGACGNACNKTTGTPACNGTKCSYACNTGKMDCNVATAPDTDGCECDTATTAAQGTVNGCCGTGCQTKHSNGLMQNFFDCQPLGTIDQPQATEACTVFTGDVTKCHAFACTGPGSNQVVCSDTAATCACWGFAGTNAGHVHANATTTCNCASAADSPWN